MVARGNSSGTLSQVTYSYGQVPGSESTVLHRGGASSTELVQGLLQTQAVQEMLQSQEMSILVQANLPASYYYTVQYPRAALANAAHGPDWFFTLFAARSLHMLRVQSNPPLLHIWHSSLVCKLHLLPRTVLNSPDLLRIYVVWSLPYATLSPSFLCSVVCVSSMGDWRVQHISPGRSMNLSDVVAHIPKPPILPSP